MNDNDVAWVGIRRKCIERMVDILERHLLSDSFSLGLSRDDFFAFAVDVLSDELPDDIERLKIDDPAVKNAPDPDEYIFTYKGLDAIIHYRLANHLIYKVESLIKPQEEYDEYRDPLDEGHSNANDKRGIFYQKAREISEEAAIKTTVDINPVARIGRGLVIDHGINTKIGGGIVLGETCIIGDNCTILNGVTLGVDDVYAPCEGRRHPKIGNNVTICGNVRILGAVEIGDNVTISPSCVVTSDIPDNGKVSIINQLQIEPGGLSLDAKEKMTIWGLVPVGSNFNLCGENLNNMNQLYICSNDTHRRLLDANVIQCLDKLVVFSFNVDRIVLPKEISLCVKSDKQMIYLINHPAMKDLKDPCKQEI